MSFIPCARAEGSLVAARKLDFRRYNGIEKAGKCDSRGMAEYGSRVSDANARCYAACHIDTHG